MIFARTVRLAEVTLHPAVERVKLLFRETHPGVGRGFPTDFDFARYSVALELALPGGSVLDVGVGSGQLVNALAFTGCFEKVEGIDVLRHSKYVRFTDEYRLLPMSVADMTFGDAEFDVVICMEVLEHLEDPLFCQALAELRRVTARQLLVSVPYREPEPLPPYHKQRFTDERLVKTFPDASLCLLRKPGVSWVFIEELRSQARE